MKKNNNRFKQTEIGLIPEDWNVVRLGDVAELLRGVSWRKEEANKSGRGLPIIAIPNIGIGTLNFDFRYFLTREVSTKKLLKKGDILFVGSSGSIHNIGRNVLVRFLPLNKISFASFSALIRPEKSEVTSDFLYYLINSKWIDFKKFTKRAADGKYNFQLRDFQSNVTIPLPSLPEQQKIARVLSKIQQTIEQQDKIIEATKNLRKSLMQKLFSEGLINGFMFDTVIFNKILDNEIDLNCINRDYNYFVTHIQFDELNNTKGPTRRDQLLNVFKLIKQEEILTESGVWGISKWGKFKWSNGKFYELIKSRLDKKKKKLNNTQDTLIAETAIKNNLILVTEDKSLLEVANESKGEAITLSEFLKEKYRKFKDTEIGQIPKSWEVGRLEKVGKIIMGQSPPGNTYNQLCKGEPFLQGKAEFGTISPKHIKYTTKPLKIAPKRSVLISVRAPVGNVNIADIDYCIGRGLASITLENGENVFLFYLLNYFKTNIEKEGTGSTFKEINKSKLENLPIPLPPVPEQQEIAHILSTVDKKIEAEEKRKSTLKELFKTMLHKLMTGEIRLKEIEL